MAVVIHTRKGKYQYAYEHTRKGDKVISKYMYPVNDRGDKIKQYQGKVAQQKKKYYGTIVSSLGDKSIAPTEITTDHKPEIEYGGIGSFCKWHTSIKERDKYSVDMIKKGYKVDIKEYDKYYNKNVKVAQQPKEKEVAQQTNIDTEIKEMEVYAALHTKKVRKKHTFKKCPVCGSTNIRIIDLRPLGHKNSSQCRECGHTL
jgi:predicted RNA-binding Zn-ribbon protein involved in translation (DUF1610 family)